MTSLFSRLQKLNKEATPPEWSTADAWIAGHNWIMGGGHSWVTTHPIRERDAALIVECRNSLPAVLNLIEAAHAMVLWDYVGDADQDVYERLERAVAVFVSGQEEPKPCPRCFGKGLENQDDKPGILLGPLGEMECRACGGTGVARDG